MAPRYSEIQELLRSRADLHARLNLMPYDGTPEIKERGDGKYLYVRKRVAGRQTSTYILKNCIIYSLEMPEKPVRSEGHCAALKNNLPRLDILKTSFLLMLSTISHSHTLI